LCCIGRTTTINSPVAYLYSADPEHCSADKWDYGILKEIFERNHTEQIRVETLPETDRAFVVIPGPQNIGMEKQVSDELNKIGRVVLFVTGDEARVFDVTKLTHPNMEIWVHYLSEHEKGVCHSLPIGTPVRISDFVPVYPEKIYDAFFGGQITHTRRQDVAKVMPSIRNSLFRPSEGFTQGDGPKEYYEYLSSARFCPCPAGSVVVDTFRFFEAIEMLTIPVGDLRNSSGEADLFMFYALDTPPVPMVDSWDDLQEAIDSCMPNYHALLHHVVSWWIKYKRDISFKVMEQVNAN
jgi:hypothetical protein